MLHTWDLLCSRKSQDQDPKTQISAGPGTGTGVNVGQGDDEILPKRSSILHGLALLQRPWVQDSMFKSRPVKDFRIKSLGFPPCGLQYVFGR